MLQLLDQVPSGHGAKVARQGADRRRGQRGAAKDPINTHSYRSLESRPLSLPSSTTAASLVIIVSDEKANSRVDLLPTSSSTSAP
jgi:hypothetical protein